MATTERGIYYTAAADDSTVADFNVITKRIADSTEAALDALEGQSTPFCSGTWLGSGFTVNPMTGAQIGFNSGVVDTAGLFEPGWNVNLTRGVWQVAASAGLLGPSEDFRLQMLLGDETVAMANNGQWLSCAGALRVTSASPPALVLLACNDGSVPISVTWARLSVARIGAA